MTKENPFENWTYVSRSSDITKKFKIREGDYNSREKVLEARGYCESRDSEFVREDLFKYNGMFLLVIEKKDKEDVTSLLIPGFVRRNKIMGKNKIYPVSSDSKEKILRYLNRDNIDSGLEKMGGIFWNTEIEAVRNGPFYSSLSIAE